MIVEIFKMTLPETKKTGTSHFSLEKLKSSQSAFPTSDFPFTTWYLSYFSYIFICLKGRWKIKFSRVKINQNSCTSFSLFVLLSGYSGAFATFQKKSKRLVLPCYFPILLSCLLFCHFLFRSLKMIISKVNFTRVIQSSILFRYFVSRIEFI